MTDQEKQELARQIKAELGELEATITRLEGSVGPVAPDVSLGRLTRMDAIGQKSVNEANLANSKAKKEQLEGTLLRLQEPGFGQCAQCGANIPLARIQAVPESDKCVNCA